MTAPAAAHKFNDLYLQALRYLRRQDEPTPFALKKLERDAESLSNASLSGSFEIRAFIAAVSGDSESVRSFYERALATASDHYLGTLIRALNIWQMIGEPDLLIKHYQSNRDLIGSSPEAMRAVELVLACSGFFQASASVASRMESQGIARDARLVSSEEGLAERPTPADGYEDKDVAQIVGFVNRHMWQNHARVVAVQPNLLHLETGDSALLITLFVGDNAEQTASLEWNLFGALADADFPLEAAGKVRVTLTPREHDDAEGTEVVGMEPANAD